MSEPAAVSSQDRRVSSLVFISYATADRKEATRLSRAIERRGTKCWISARDVALGENYQEAIVHSIRCARAIVLVFSQAANTSDEIKKELSLASRFRVPVMAVRIEEVEPSDAFAYELSTRQWIDAFAGWDRSIDTLVRRIAELPVTETRPASVSDATIRHRSLAVMPRYEPRACAPPNLAEIAQACTPFLLLDARVGTQRIERTKLSLHRGLRKFDAYRRHHASFIGTGAVLTFPSTKIAWNCLPAQRATP